MEPRSPALQADPLPAEPQVKPINTLPCVKWLVEPECTTGSSAGCSMMTWMGGLVERGGCGREVQERGDTCRHRANSLCYATETNATLQSNYTPVIFKVRNLQSDEGDRCVS